MNVIFLDFDGVMVTNFSATQSFRYLETSGGPFGPARVFDPAAVKALNSIHARIPSKIVISSTWRLIFKHSALIGYLKEQGVEIDVIGQTPYDSYRGTGIEIVTTRGGEIALWLSRHPEIVNYVVLDDDSQIEELASSMDFFERRVLSRWVQTHFATGLTQELADRAVGMLAGFYK